MREAGLPGRIIMSAALVNELRVSLYTAAEPTRPLNGSNKEWRGWLTISVQYGASNRGSAFALQKLNLPRRQDFTVAASMPTSHKWLMNDLVPMFDTVNPSSKL